MQRKTIAIILLVLGLAFVFGVFGIGKFQDPLLWIGWMPPWMDGFLGLPASSWLRITGIGEILLAILLLIPVRALQRIIVIFMSLHLLAVLTQTGWNDIAVRDIGLLLSCLSLLFLL
ncbi:hypothetical protein HZA45_02060 [Candidatus Peregrinibacteria bacterium]|nr:hypothetical protein [Candidatus Peregrinibacteria bacterium]